MPAKNYEDSNDDCLLDSLIDDLATRYDFEYAMQQKDFATAISCIERDNNLLYDITAQFSLEFLAQEFSQYLLKYQKKNIFQKLWAQGRFQQYCCGQEVFCNATSSYQQRPFESIRCFFEKVIDAQNIDCVTTLWRVNAISHYYLSLPIVAKSEQHAGSDLLSFFKKVSSAQCLVIIDDIVLKKRDFISYLQGRSVPIVGGHAISASPYELFVLLQSFISSPRKSIVSLMLSKTKLALLLQGQKVRSDSGVKLSLPIDELFELLNKALLSNCTEIVNLILKNPAMLDFLQGKTIIGRGSAFKKLDFNTAMNLIHSRDFLSGSSVLSQLLKNQEICDYLIGKNRLPANLEEFNILTQILKDAVTHRKNQVIFLMSHHPLLQKLFRGDKIVFENTGESEQITFEELIDWIKLSNSSNSNSLFTWLLKNPVICDYLLGKHCLWCDGSCRQISFSEAMSLFSDGLKYQSKMVTAYMLLNTELATALVTNPVRMQFHSTESISFKKIWEFFVTAVNYGDNNVIDFLLKNKKLSSFLKGEHVSCTLETVPEHSNSHLLTLLQKSVQHSAFTAIKVLLSNEHFNDFLEGKNSSSYEPPVTPELYPFLRDILHKSFSNKCFIALKPLVKNKSFVKKMFDPPHTVESKNQRLLLIRAFVNRQEPIFLEICTQEDSPIKLFISELHKDKLVVLLKQLIQEPCENCYFQSVLDLVKNREALEDLIASYSDKKRIEYFITVRLLECSKRVDLLAVSQGDLSLTSAEQLTFPQIESANSISLPDLTTQEDIAPFLEQLMLALSRNKSSVVTGVLNMPLVVSYLQGATHACVQGQIKTISMQEALIFFNLALRSRNNLAIKIMAHHKELWPALTTDNGVFHEEELLSFFHAALTANSFYLVNALWEGGGKRLQSYLSKIDDEQSKLLLKKLVVVKMPLTILVDFLRIMTNKAMLQNYLQVMRSKNKASIEINSRLSLIEERIAELDEVDVSEDITPSSHSAEIVFTAQKRPYSEIHDHVDLRESQGIKKARMIPSKDQPH